jgi:hypothetical protein
LLKYLNTKYYNNIKMEPHKDEAIEKMLEQLANTGEKRFVTTSIYGDADIRNFLYYSSKILKSPELNIELQYIVAHPGSSKLFEPIDSVFQYEEVAKEKLLLACWYSGEKEEDAFTRTETSYIINEKKKINGIITFRDEKISKDFLYIYVSGRFASEEDGKAPVFWDPIRIHCKSLRDLILYVILNEDLQKLGIEFEPVSNPSSAPSCSDAVETTSDAVEANSDAVETTSDAVEGNSDAVEGNSDAVEATSDAVEGNSDALEATSDAVEATSDAVEGNSDALEATEFISDIQQ